MLYGVVDRRFCRRTFKQTEGGKKIMCDMMEKLEKRGEKRGEMKSLI